MSLRQSYKKIEIKKLFKIKLASTHLILFNNLLYRIFDYNCLDLLS